MTLYDVRDRLIEIDYLSGRVYRKEALAIILPLLSEQEKDIAFATSLLYEITGRREFALMAVDDII